MLLDGDNVRHGLNRDLGFTDADRVENIRRVGEVAKLMSMPGSSCSARSSRRSAPSARWRASSCAEGEFIEVFVDTPIEDCMRRDPKGLYAKATAARSRISPESMRPMSRRSTPISFFRPPITIRISSRERSSSTCAKVAFFDRQGGPKIGLATTFRPRYFAPAFPGERRLSGCIGTRRSRLRKGRSSDRSPFLGTRAGIAGRLAGGLARAAIDPDRGRELWHRLQDYERYDDFRSGTTKPRKIWAAPATGDVPFPVLVTSNAGLYLLEPGGWHRLLDVICFGVARHANTLFVGASAGLHSFVIAAEIAGQRRSTRSSTSASWRDTRRGTTTSEFTRSVTIRAEPGVGRELPAQQPDRRDLSGRGIVDEKFLMVDPSGSPFITDQNHVNAVAVNGDTLLFGARYAGTGSGLGFCVGQCRSGLSISGRRRARCRHP